MPDSYTTSPENTKKNNAKKTQTNKETIIKKPNKTHSMTF